MPKFLVITHQNGGCDYTIGCGISVEEIEAPDLDTARERTLDALMAEGHDDLISSLLSIEVRQLADIDCRLDDAHWGERWRTKREAENKARQDAKDAADFARLKNKFGGS